MKITDTKSKFFGGKINKINKILTRLRMQIIPVTIEMVTITADTIDIKRLIR